MVYDSNVLVAHYSTVIFSGGLGGFHWPPLPLCCVPQRSLKMTGTPAPGVRTVRSWGSMVAPGSGDRVNFWDNCNRKDKRNN